MDLNWLDSLEFEAIPAPVHYYNIPRVVVSEKGLMTMNPAFQRLAGEARSFYGELSKDGVCLLLHPNERGSLQFTAKGVRSNRKLSDRLRALGIQFPAVYTLEWLDERKMWVGCSNDLPSPPKIEELLPKRSKRGKR